MKTIHIIYVAEDGLISLRCGVGTIAQHFISAFPAIADAFKVKGIKLKLSAITLTSNESSVGVDKKIEEKTKRICNEFSGDLYFVKSGRKLFDEYFNFSLWEVYTNKINGVLTKIISSQDYRTVVIANDTIFAKVIGKGEGVISVWIPHSLAEVHSQSYVDNEKRLLWEKRAIAHKNLDKNSYVGCISPYAKKLLIRLGTHDYKIIPFYNGFYLPVLKKIRYSQPVIRKMMKHRGIPLNKKIVFSFGRADEYKGLDIALLAMIKIVKKYKNYHGVLIASAFSKEEIVEKVQDKLKKILEENKKSPVTLFLGYEFVLPKYILQYNKTQFLLHLPTKDFCPLVPFEAAILGHNKLAIINSNIECLKDTIKNNYDGFLCNPEVNGVVGKVEEIISKITGKKLKEIILREKDKVLAQRDLVENYSSALYSLVRK